MKCCVCKLSISSGAAAQKMIVEYTQPGGAVLLYGYMMDAGPLSAATGRILRGYHHKCFWAVRKREARGDAVTGRVLNGIPNAYEISDLVLSREEAQALGISDAEIAKRGTAYITERLDMLRAVARRIGKGVGDATVLEAFWAGEHGGPYPHTHHLPLEVYQLRAHLVYAHGVERGQMVARGGVQAIHGLLHARAAAAQTARERDDDPGFAPTTESDWRSQVVEDVGNLSL